MKNLNGLEWLRLRRGNNVSIKKKITFLGQVQPSKRTHTIKGKGKKKEGEGSRLRKREGKEKRKRKGKAGKGRREMREISLGGGDFLSINILPELTLKILYIY